MAAVVVTVLTLMTEVAEDATEAVVVAKALALEEGRDATGSTAPPGIEREFSHYTLDRSVH